MTDIFDSIRLSHAGLFEGRFLDPALSWTYNGGSAPGYAINELGRLYRNGEPVGWALRVTFDREASGFWVEYRSWHGSALDMGGRRR